MSIDEIVARLRESRENEAPQYADKVERILNYRLGDYETDAKVIQVQKVSETSKTITLKVSYETEVKIPVSSSEDGLTYYDYETEYRESTMTFDREELEGSKSVKDSIVYYPRDDSDRDNSAEIQDKERREKSHPYVGRRVRWSEDKRIYQITGAYEDYRGVIVRCGNITMRPDEYSLIREATIEKMEFATDSEAYEWAEENGYEVDKIQNCKRGKSCIAYMFKSTGV